MLSELQKALVKDQKVQITVWDPQNEAAEYTFGSYVVESVGLLFRVALPASQVTNIFPLLRCGATVGVVLETYPNPYIFYPAIHQEPPSLQSPFWLKIPENAEIEVIQRRRHVRIPMVIPFDLQYEIAGRPITVNARTEDVSGGGMRFTSIRLFPKDQEITVNLKLSPAEPPLRLKAKVVFSAQNRIKMQPDDLYTTACQFLELDDAEEMVLVRECFRRELGLKS